MAKQPWDGILDGTLNGAPCIQLERLDETPVVGSEDCLFLNVYTPKLPQQDQVAFAIFLNKP